MSLSVLFVKTKIFNIFCLRKTITFAKISFKTENFGNVCEEEEYWSTNLNDIHDDEALTNLYLDILQQSEGQNTFDRLGRKHNDQFSSGAVHMVLHAVEFSPSTAKAHTNNLYTSIAYCPSKRWKRSHIPHG